MIKEGTKVLIEGIPYKIVSVSPGTLGRYMLVISHDTDTGTDIRISMTKLMERLQECADDLFAVSRLIVDWWTDEKLKAGLNTNQILTVKANPERAQGQVRRLLRQGTSIEEIVEVLAFAITDKFWSGVLNTSINTLAVPRLDGISPFEKIRTKMIAERHADLTEIHQPTEEEMIGIEVTE